VKDARVTRGTVIATFDSDGSYGNHTNGTSHTAIFLQQLPNGIRVLDQWVSHKRDENGKTVAVPQPVHERVIRFRGAPRLENDGNNYYVVEWLPVVNWLFIYVIACATCPQSIKDGSQSYALKDASLFDGPPEELADLEPDNDGEMEWSLSDYQQSAQQRGQALYFVCKYSKTTKTLSLKVPQAATACSVVMREGQTIAGCE